MKAGVEEARRVLADLQTMKQDMGTHEDSRFAIAKYRCYQSALASFGASSHPAKCTTNEPKKAV